RQPFAGRAEWIENPYLLAEHPGPNFGGLGRQFALRVDGENRAVIAQPVGDDGRAAFAGPAAGNGDRMLIIGNADFMAALRVTLTMLITLDYRADNAEKKLVRFIPQRGRCD